METRRKQLHAALLDAFTLDEMERLLAFMGGERRDLPEGRNKEAIFFELVEQAWREGWMLDLAKAAYEARAANEKVKAFAENHLRTVFAELRPARSSQRRFMNEHEYIPDEGTKLSDRVQRIEFQLSGFNGYRGMIGELQQLKDEIKGFESKLGLMETTLDQVLTAVRGMDGAPRANHDPWLTWLFWAVLALAVLALGVLGSEAVANLAAWMGG